MPGLLRRPMPCALMLRLFGRGSSTASWLKGRADDLVSAVEKISHRGAIRLDRVDYDFTRPDVDRMRPPGEADLRLPVTGRGKIGSWGPRESGDAGRGPGTPQSGKNHQGHEDEELVALVTGGVGWDRPVAGEEVRLRILELHIDGMESSATSTSRTSEMVSLFSARTRRASPL